MKKINKNGIIILDEGFEKEFEKNEKTAEIEIAVPLNVLGEKIKKAFKAKKAAEKAAKKAEKHEILKKAAEKRAAQKAVSAANAHKLLKFLKGEVANFVASSLEEEVNFEEADIKLNNYKEASEKLTEVASLYKEEIKKIAEKYNEECFYYYYNEEEIKRLEKEAYKIYKEILGFFSKDPKTRYLIRKTFDIENAGYVFSLEKVANGELDNSYLFQISDEEIEEVVKKIIRERGRYYKARETGITRPDLAKYYNIDPKAFLWVEKVAVELGLKPEESVYDSYGVWGLSPHDIAKAWYASGVKNGPKFRIWVKRALEYLKENGRVDENMPALPKKEESVREYKERLSLMSFYTKYSRNINSDTFFRMLRGDLKRVAKLTSYTKFYTLTQCVEETEEGKKAVNWEKVAKFLKMNKWEKAAYLPLNLAWSLLFKRKYPAGLNSQDPNPTVLKGVTQKTFRSLMKIVKDESFDESALAANTKAAYHLAIAFKHLNAVERWVKIVTGEKLNAQSIHDAFVDANVFTKVKYHDAWVSLLAQFPELRWSIKYAYSFELAYNRTPKGKREFEDFVAIQHFENVKNQEVAEIAAKLNLNQDEFEDYQKFFEENLEKDSTMLPNVQVSEGEYTFRKLDDFDKRGPFLGLMTDCCQHLHNAGASCAKAGWRDPESGFYIVEKNGNIVAQSWAWRGKNGELCFDSIEGLGNVNVKVIARLYKKAAQQLLGKLCISRVTVGDTSYGLTSDIKKILGGVSCEAAKMIKKVSYTDAKDQWLLASPK
jgi:hypothetical protein